MMNIPFSPPDMSELEIEAVADVLRSGWITTGKKTEQFEKMLAEYIGTERVVCTNSQTSAMELVLRVLGIGPGDEVIVPAYTYTATASVVHHTGARIVMVDTAPDSFEADCDAIARAITPRTKAIIPVDVGGRLCDYRRMISVAEDRAGCFSANSPLQSAIGRVAICADSAHGFGSEQNGKQSGNQADLTTFSFHAVKNITTGDGGAITWKKLDGVDDGELFRVFALYSLHGQDKGAGDKGLENGSWEYDVIYPAYKCNMTDIAAAVGIKQLERYPEMLERRRQIAKLYDDALRPLGIKTLVHSDRANETNRHLYMTRIDGIGEKERNGLILRMAKAGIACNVHFKPLSMLTAYKKLGFDVSAHPNAYAQYKNEITLPLYSRLSLSEAEYVAETFCREAKRYL